MNYYSVTINVAPYKKLSVQHMTACFGENYSYFGVSNQFHKMTSDCQKKMLQYILTLVRKKLNDYSSVVEEVFEPTKRGDHHLHVLLMTKDAIDAEAKKGVRELSAGFGCDYYNPAIHVEYCTDGGNQWIKYIHKLDAKAPASPQDSPVGSPKIFSNLYNKIKKENKE